MSAYSSTYSYEEDIYVSYQKAPFLREVTLSDEYADYTVRVIDDENATLMKLIPKRETIETLTLPDIADGVPITALGEWACFDLPATIGRVILPDSVRIIGHHAFSMSKIAAFSFGKGLMTLSWGAFSKNPILTCITLPNTVKTIDPEAFAKCSALREVTLPEELPCLAEDTFLGCSALTQVHLPKSLVRLAEGVFSDCTALSSLTLPEGLRAIDHYVFTRCRALTALTLPNSIQEVEKYAFYGCRTLTVTLTEESAARLHAYDPDWSRDIQIKTL
ncbi:MAG: leucine-rich repeat domain-containing protein [Clostridia bacterium]|nr:leucine-rich repeat domain-containing protein [Clostridia bacterium]